MKKLNEEFKKMEKNYRELIKNKDKEYNKKRYFIFNFHFDQKPKLK